MPTRILENRKSLYLIGAFLLLIATNTLLRFPEILSLGLINDDAALYHGAVSDLKNNQLIKYLYTSYGPNVIRPWEIYLLAFYSLLPNKTIWTGYFVGIALLSFSQFILLCSLRRWTSDFGASFAALIIGISIFTSEPVLWLSDHHDLTLILFFSLSIFSYCKLFELPSKPLFRVGWILLYIVFVWGGFYSNEKGVAIPVIISIVSVIELLLNISSYNNNKRQKVFITLLFCFFNFILFSSYFYIRYQILGVLIGGYDNSILPQEGLTKEHLLRWLHAISHIPFWQISYDKLQISRWVLAPILILNFIIFLRGKSQKKWLIIFGAIILIIVSSAPTFKYNMPTSIGGISNIRFYWLPHIVLSSLIGLLIGQPLHSLRLRLLLRSLSCLILISHIIGMRDGLVAFESANKLTKRALHAYRDHCSCASTTSPQSKGLPPTWNGVNTFTESIWIDYIAGASILPFCNDSHSTDKCEIIFEGVIDNSFNYHVKKSSNSVLASIKDMLTNHNSSPYVVKINIEAVVKDSLSGSLEISGWGYEKRSSLPLRALAIKFKDRIIAFSRPNQIRGGIPGTSGKTSNYGFKLIIPSEFVSQGGNYEVIAFRKDKNGIHKSVVYKDKF